MLLEVMAHRESAAMAAMALLLVLVVAALLMAAAGVGVAIQQAVQAAQVVEQMQVPRFLRPPLREQLILAAVVEEGLLVGLQL